jgi:tetratricopeptide (TPR) repeat protein
MTDAVPTKDAAITCSFDISKTSNQGSFVAASSQSLRYHQLAMPNKSTAFVFLFTVLSLPALPQNAPVPSDTVQQHLQNARQDLGNQRPDLAIPELEAVIAIDPVNQDAQANLGVLLFFRGEMEKAVPHLRIAVKAQPDLWKIQALLGLAEVRLKDQMNARSDLESALPHLKGEKVQMEVGNALVAIYSASGELEKAADVASVMLESQPTDPGLLLLSYRLNSAAAGTSLLTLAMAAPHSAEMHQAMARELIRHGDEAAAIANYHEAIRLNPKLPGLLFDFGAVLYKSDDPKLKAEAEAQFKAALAANPQDEKAQLMIGQVAAQRGDLKAAYDAESQAVEMQPNDGDAWTEFAKILISMNERDKARALLEHALEIDPTNYTAHYRLGTLYRQQGKQEEARRELADYQKYKDMKDQLRALFHNMRVQLDDKPEDEEDTGK